MAEGNIIFRLQASVIMGLDGLSSQIRCVGDTVNFRVSFRVGGGAFGLNLTPLGNLYTKGVNYVAPPKSLTFNFAPPCKVSK